MDIKGGSEGSVRFPLVLGKGIPLNYSSKPIIPPLFGLDGKDVFDETCRKAGKLDRSYLLIDFYPHDYGIIEPTQKILHSSMNQAFESIGIGTQGIRAELYMLNGSTLSTLILELLGNLFSKRLALRVVACTESMTVRPIGPLGLSFY